MFVIRGYVAPFVIIRIEPISSTGDADCAKRRIAFHMEFHKAFKFRLASGGKVTAESENCGNRLLDNRLYSK